MKTARTPPTPAFDREQLAAAHRIVNRTMSPTPQYSWPLLSQRCGAEVVVKHENQTPVGAFKVRGGLVYLAELAQKSPRPRKLITATRGNHGQSIPFAATRYGFEVKVVVPRGNSREKNQAMRAWGAELIVHGRDFDQARAEASRLAEVEERHFVPSFHPSLVRGVATYADELFEAHPDLATVYVPIGMGSGACGLIETRDLLGIETEIVGVVSAHADAYATSFESGRVIETATAHTIADGMACRVPSAEALRTIRRGAARIVRVTDDQVAEAMRILFSATHQVAEGAGAAALAALITEQDRVQGEKVAVVLSGGNIDTGLFAEILAGRTPKLNVE